MAIWECTWLWKKELAVDKELCMQIWQQQHAQKQALNPRKAYGGKLPEVCPKTCIYFRIVNCVITASPWIFRSFN